MRAAVIREHGGPDVLRLVDDHPDPVADNGHVVIRVLATALNYHDIFTRRGMPGIKVPMPMIMGIDMAGVIVARGPDVLDWAVGDRVLVDPINREKGGLIGEMWPGGLAEYCRVPVHQLVALPPDIAPSAAAALPVAYGTGHRMMVTRGNVRAGERVLILGASGGVGTCCVQLAKLRGAEVIACAGSPEKLDRLRELGADHVIDYRSEDLVAAVHSRFGKPARRGGDGGVDMVVNFTGGETWVPSLRCLRRGGRMLTCGATAGYDPRTDIRYIWTFELGIVGSNGWGRSDLLELLLLVKSGKLRPVVDAVLPLDAVHQAFKSLEDRQLFGKLVLAP